MWHRSNTLLQQQDTPGPLGPAFRPWNRDIVTWQKSHSPNELRLMRGLGAVLRAEGRILAAKIAEAPRDMP